MHDMLDRLPFKIGKGEQLKRSMKLLEEKRRLLLRAPPGSGKTAASLSYLLSKAKASDRSVIFFRTKAEIDQGLNLLNQMVEEMEHPPLIAPLVGKMEACLYPPADTNTLRWWCKLSRCGKRDDRWRSGLVAAIRQLEGTGLSIERYVDALRKRDLCPYYALRRLAKKADILLTTYPFLTDTELFTYVGEREFVFLDEAHTLLMLITGKLKKITYKQGKDLVKEAEEQGIAPHKYTVSLLQEEEREQAVTLANYLSFERAEGTIYTTRKKVLKVWPPRQLIGKRISDGRLMVMSSTLYPSSLFKTIFGIREMRLIPGMLRPSKKRLILGITQGLTSQYKKRSGTMYRRYARTIKLMTKHLQVPTLIFAPSYAFATSLSKYLDLPPTRDVEEIPQNMQQYGKVLSVARGRLSEGIDLSYGGVEPQLLILTGLPYPKLSDTFKAVAQVYSEAYHMQPGRFLKALNQSSMISALVQMIGRTGRQKKGVAAILDERIRHFDFSFPLFHSISSAVAGIKKFGVGDESETSSRST